MKRITGFFVTACLCSLFLVAVSPVRAQDSCRTSIFCTDGVPGDSILLSIGVNPLATYGIDSTTLGEKEQPPIPPPTVFNAVLVDPRGNHATGQGLLLDLRPFFWLSQYDTFEIDYQRDSIATANSYPMTFSWAANLDTIFGVTRWKMIDPVTGGGLINIDMGSRTSYQIPLSYSVGKIWIIKSDAAQFRSFCYETMALDKSNKGALGTADLTTAITVKFSGTITQNFVPDVDSIIVAFSDKIYDSTLTYTPFTHKATKSPKTDNKTFYIGGATIDSLQTFTLAGIGQVGKAMKKVTVSLFYQGLPKPLKGKNTFDVTTSFTFHLQLPMPDIANAGAKLMATMGYTTKGSYGLIIGDSSYHGSHHFLPHLTDTTLFIYHNTWANVVKSLEKVVSKVPVLHAGPSATFQTLLLSTSKHLLKKQVALDPVTGHDPLFAEALALKLNILFSEHDVAGNDLKNLLVVDTVNGSSLAFIGKSVGYISAAADTFITWGKVKDAALAGVSVEGFHTMLQNINCAFQGPLDTVSWAGGIPMFKPAMYISDVTWLKRDPGNPSVTIPMRRQAAASVPAQYTLRQNYPNPFNPTTTIEFSLPEASFVTVKVYNMLGQEVMTLADHQQFASGTGQVRFNAAQYASGVYFYRLQVNDLGTGALKFQQIRKMMLLK